MNKNNRVLFLLHLPPPVHGAAMVGKSIHDSELINGEFDSHYINLTTASSLEDIGKVGLKKVLAFRRLLQEIRNVVKHLKLDLVYVSPNAKGGAFYKDFIVIMMLKRMGCRVVVHYHNKGVSTKQNRWIDNLLYRRFFKGIKVILLGKSLYRDVEKYVKWEDVYICPNGIPVQKDGTVEFRKPRENNVPRLLFLSNLLVSKGVLVLLDALAVLRDRGYSFICDFVGGETAELDAASFQLEVEKRRLIGIANYQGKRYGLDKEEFFEQADIFVFPTFYDNECFPLVLLEAMWQGLPCISTNEGAISDIVNDGVNGFIVERKNSLQLADKIAQLIDDKDLRVKMGIEGHKKFLNEFTLEHFEKNISRILADVCQR